MAMKKASQKQLIAEVNSQKNGVKPSSPEINLEYLNMSFWVDNKTSARFAVVGCDLSWGKWAEAPVAIQSNRDNQLPFRSNGRAHAPSGTEGWVKFQSDQFEAAFTVQWEVPFGARDGYLTLNWEGKGSANYDYKITHYDPNSSDPNPRLTITKGIGVKSKAS
jgi:hypothetical protein